VTVIDGCETIIQEIADTPVLRSYIAEQFRALMENPAFLDALPGYLLPRRRQPSARTHSSQQNPANGRSTQLRRLKR
jgi:hypothetical protein